MKIPTVLERTKRNNSKSQRLDGMQLPLISLKLTKEGTKPRFQIQIQAVPNLNVAVHTIE